MSIDVDREIGLAWHDVTCPEAGRCRDRELHARSAPLATSGLLRRFVNLLLVDGAVLGQLASPQAIPPGLSDRELDVVRLVAKGMPNKVIAARLEISPYTVSSHMRRIFGKLGATTRAQMISKATERGLL